MTVKTFIRTCLVCDVKFQRISHGKYCSSRCTKIAGRTKSRPSKGNQDRRASVFKCSKCKSPFASLLEEATLCNSCKAVIEGTGKAAGKRKLACERCEHWVPKEGAELGFECKAHLWMRCKPYLPNAEPWSPKS